MEFKAEIVKLLNSIIKIEPESIEIPPDSKLGDFAVPCFKFAKQFRKSPQLIAKEITEKLPLSEIFSKIVPIGPYINFFINPLYYTNNVIKNVLQKKEEYGSSTIGKGKNIVIDYSSPNIAKPFGIAHIRSTVIGNAIYKIYSALGYYVIRVNHLGDWGTQFGKLMVAYKKWGKRDLLEKDGIDYLVQLYIDFGNHVKEHPELENEARLWFKKLEDNDDEAVVLWKQFRELSLIEFKKYYDELEIDFDYIQGESFYNNQLDTTIAYVKKNLPTEISEGALIVRLDDKGIDVPVLLQKSDGATTYHTRDIAAILYRLKTYTPYRIIYVVGIPQQLHFRQLFAVMEKLGEKTDSFVHVTFGNMSFEGEMMSTRKGNFVLLRDVLEESIKLAKKIIEEKNPQLEHKEKIAQKVGIGAVIFGDLMNDRTRDVDFKWENVLNFEGETAPYVQYTYARICSVQRKAGDLSSVKIDLDYSILKEDIEFELVKTIGQFPTQIESAAQIYKPNLIANYLVLLAQKFNQFYNNKNCPILKADLPLKNARLNLLECVRIILKKGLNLLGIHELEEM